MQRSVIVGTSLIVVVLIAFFAFYLIQIKQTNLSSDQTQRIVSLAPSDTQILVSLGLGKDIVAVDQYSYSLIKLLNETKCLPQNVTVLQLQAGSPPNVSGLVLLHPSIVIDEEGLIGSYATLIKNAGLHLLLTNDDYAQNFSQITASILNVSNQIGAKSQGEKLVSWMNDKLQSFSTQGNVSVAYLLYICPNYEFYTAGGNVFINDIITKAGGSNVFSNQSGYPLLGPSSLDLANPQVIIAQEVYNISYTEFLISHMPGITSTRAYQENRIYVLSQNLPTDLINEPGPLSVYSVEMVRDILNNASPHYVNSSFVLKDLNVSLPVF
ncbi:MAG: ABC transporter substrate-binding protein [Metallosphaera sp.]